MSYDIDITPTAAEDLAGLPAPVAEFVYQQLLRFAEHPTRWSVPSHFPYVQGQAFKIETELDGPRYLVHVVFRYGQDESTLHILHLGVQRI